MAGTKEGGKKAAVTNKERYGDDFYQKNAFKAQDAWARNGRKPRGFSLDRDRARTAGVKGGTKSSRLGIRSGEGKRWSS